MPRLPTASDMGQAPIIQPTRNFTRYSPLQGTEVAGQALSNTGQAIQEIGNAMGVMESRLTEARRAAQLTDAVGRATYDLGNLEIQYGQDQDYKTSPARFDKDAESLRVRYETTIDDPAVKAAFTQHFRGLATTKRLGVLKQAVGQEQEYNINALNSGLDITAKAAARAQSEQERQQMIAQAEIGITQMQQAGWISRLDAGNRLAKFQSTVDEVRVMDSMRVDPGDTALRLMSDPEYAPNISPVDRARFIKQGYDQTQDLLNQAKAKVTKEHQVLREETMKEAWTLDAKAQLTRSYVEQKKPILSDGEYHSLLIALENSHSGERRQSDPQSVALMEQALNEEPEEAAKLALRLHREGKLNNSNLASYSEKARSATRREGPKSEYERARDYISRTIRPGEGIYDPAASARFAGALREYEDYAASGKRSDEDLRKKADTILKTYSLVDMRDIARKTSAGVRNSPEAQLEAIGKQAAKFMTERDNGKITAQEFNRKMAELQRARNAVQRALELHGQ